MSKTKSLIYAELLSNIRQISVIASLDTPCDAATKVELAPQGQRVVLTHAGETISLNLPGHVAASSRLQKPALGSRELSWRLPLADAPASSALEHLQENEAPWSAKQLGNNPGFACRNCNTTVLKEGVIETWKDLPSENWAEMMEFWHCHKPDVPEHEQNHEQNHESNGASGQSQADFNANRGYGANTKFVARPGTAFIDSTTFLLSENDCSGLSVRFWSHFSLLGIYFREFVLFQGYQEGGHASSFAFQLSGHRYKYPKLIIWSPFRMFQRTNH